MPDSDFWVDTLPGQSVTRPWDHLILGVIDLPGMWQLDLATKLDYDEAKTPITLGSAKKNIPPTFRITVTDKGYSPAKLTAIGKVWLLTDWILLKAKLPLIAPKKTSSVRSLWSITHPAAALLGITQVSIVGVSIPPPNDQTLMVRIDMVQWFQQAPILPLFDSGGAAVAPPAKPVNPAANAQ